MNAGKKERSGLVQKQMAAEAAVYAFVIASVLTLIVWQIGIFFAISNLKLYAVTFILYLILFIAVFLPLSKMKKRKAWHVSEKGIVVSFFICVIVFFVFMTQSFFAAETMPHSSADTLSWHRMPWLLVLLFIVSAFLVVFYLTNGFSLRESMLSKRGEKFLFWGACLICACIVYCFSYYPASIMEYVSLHHEHAYYNSIYNVMHGIPYSDEVTSVYGHYAILLAPILNLVRIFGATDVFHIFTMCMSLLVALSYLLACYAIYSLVTNRYIRYIGLIALLLIPAALKSSPYYQIYPHRTIIIALFIALMAFHAKHAAKRKWVEILGFIFCVLSVVWNTELGICAIAAWVGYLTYIALLRRRQGVGKCCGRIFLYVLGGLGSFAGAYLITNIYNVAAGGNVLGIMDFIFPLFSKTYDIENMLSIDLDYGASYWIGRIILFYTFIGFALVRLFSYKDNLGKADYKCAVYLGITVISMGAFSYFINRAAYGNQTISYMGVIILLCVLGQKYFVPMKRFLFSRRERKVQFFTESPECNEGLAHRKVSCLRGLKAAVGLSSMVLIFAIAVVTMTGMGHNYMKNLTLLRDKESVDLIAEEVAAKVPVGTKAMGYGIPEIYSMIGWDTQLYTMDFSDMSATEQTGIYASQQLAALWEEPLLTTARSLERLEQDWPEAVEEFRETHILANEFGINEMLAKNDIKAGFCETLQYYVPLYE
ncbi:hypothetical protein [Christensenella timonensis]|uniref:hypothetical protein n=1 Tax=Christensenella timonensis TaxID=1816678 RepID=UPI000832CAE4|nr:hypothetical protein [Christensenella timonensis]